jgi:hypothetical protein
VWDLWNISLRLEMLCSSLESPGAVEIKPPETALLERMKSRGGEITDRFLLNFVEHQISRIEVSRRIEQSVWVVVLTCFAIVLCKYAGAPPPGAAVWRHPAARTGVSDGRYLRGVARAA